MYLLVNTETNVIVYISSQATVEENGINVGDMIFANPDGTLKIVEVASVDAGVKPQKYKYVDGAFVVNADYVAPAEVTLSELQVVVDQILIDSLGV